MEARQKWQLHSLAGVKATSPEENRKAAGAPRAKREAAQIEWAAPSFFFFLIGERDVPQKGNQRLCGWFPILNQYNKKGGGTKIMPWDSPDFQIAPGYVGLVN